MISLLGYLSHVVEIELVRQSSFFRSQPMKIKYKTNWYDKLLKCQLCVHFKVNFPVLVIPSLNNYKIICVFCIKVKYTDTLRGKKAKTVPKKKFLSLSSGNLKFLQAEYRLILFFENVRRAYTRIRPKRHHHQILIDAAKVGFHHTIWA